MKRMKDLTALTATERVSIITTCLNRVDTIGRAIESVLGQDYANIEYIVIDGASTDGSMDVINQYADQMTCVISEPDGGMYEAINKGLRLATGDLVGLVHSDDVLYDGHVISRMVEAMRHSDADLFYGDGLFVRGQRVVRNWVSGANHRWKLRMGWLPLHPTCYVRRSLIDSLGGYDEQYKIAADTEWLYRYLYIHRAKTCYLACYVVKMDVGGLSTDSRRRRQMWHEDVAIFRSYHTCGIMMKLMKMAWKIPQFFGRLPKIECL